MLLLLALLHNLYAADSNVRPPHPATRFPVMAYDVLDVVELDSEAKPSTASGSVFSP
jgi:hypothetical protein